MIPASPLEVFLTPTYTFSESLYWVPSTVAQIPDEPPPIVLNDVTPAPLVNVEADCASTLGLYVNDTV